MSRQRTVIGLSLILVLMAPFPEAAAFVPPPLREVLKAHHFNVYPAPSPANDMVLRDLGGRLIHLAGMRGRVVILNFWRIDCPPCAREKPVLDRIYRHYAPRGLEILAVNLFDDQQRLRSYVQHGGYSFLFGSDPEHRFSVRKQSLSTGAVTTFVVNPKAEAIYEIPGVPTTYVIDRNGMVIGNAVGMINWESRPFLDFLELMLGPAVRTGDAMEPDFALAAGEGPGVPMDEIRSAPASHRALDSLLAQAGTGSAQPSPPLPFHVPAAPGPQAPDPVVTPSTKLSPPTGQSRLQRKPSPKPVRAQKQAPGRQASPLPQQPPAGGQLPPGRTAIQPPGVPAAAPPAVGGPALGAAGFSPPSSSGGKTLPPLPPALPYVPTTSTQPPLPRESVAPDESGHVMARVPGGQAGAPPLPGQPLGRPSAPLPPIDGLVLDAFNRTRKTPPAVPEPVHPVPSGAQPPASSFFGQLGDRVWKMVSPPQAPAPAQR